LTDTVVIAGAGHAAGQVVASLKQKKYGGRIVLIGDEPYLPYQRPPLSKKYLAGELGAERLHFKPATFYDDDNIDLLLSTRVTNIDPGKRSLTTNDGRTIAYSKLVLALGSRARQVPVAGVELPGVFYLRSIDDVNSIRSNIAVDKKVIIIGAGYIGLEVAAVCRQLGLHVTIVEMADRVMSRVVSPQVSAFYQQQHERHGVEFMLSTGLKAIHGDDHVSAVEVGDGNLLAADFVIIGAGIVPNYELAEVAGLRTDNGIAVDDRCQSSDPDIYAIGDCSSHPSDIYGRRIRLESVHNALEQAKTAASNICGIEDHYSQVPWFWSDQYDLKLQIAGLSEGYDQVVIRGEQSDNKFSCFYLREGALIAVDAINSPRDFMRAKPLIANKTIIDPVKLADPQ
jgi:3-phenylpropionate/trans-cinnamate dioxygenase ferredoxin reductase subunit